MCTRDEGEEMLRVFSKYYRRRRVDIEDEWMLDRLYHASYIDYSYTGDVLYAEASAVGRIYKPRLIKSLSGKVRQRRIRRRDPLACMLCRDEKTVCPRTEPSDMIGFVQRYEDFIEHIDYLPENP